MFRIVEEYVHITPFFGFVLLLFILLKSVKETSPSDVAVASVVLSAVNFLISNAFMCRTGKYGCTKLADTKGNLFIRFVNELIMFGVCGCIFYLVSEYNGNSDPELRPLVPFYVLAGALYLPVTMMNIIVLIIHFQSYSSREIYVSVS